MTGARGFAGVCALTGLLLLGGCFPRKKRPDPGPAPKPVATTVGSAAVLSFGDPDGEDAADRSAPIKAPSAKADAKENQDLRAKLRARDLADPVDAARRVGAPTVVVKKDGTGGCGQVTVGKRTFRLDCDDDSGEVKGASTTLFGEDDLPDGAASTAKLPEAVDFRAKNLLGPVLDQGDALSCTAVSLAAVLNREIALRTGKPGDVSPMQIWGRYHKPNMNDAANNNEGKGIVPMTLLPYDAKVADSWGNGRPVPQDLLARIEPQSIVKINDVVKVGVRDIKGELAQGHAIWFAIHGAHAIQKTVGPKDGPQVIPAYDYRTFPSNQTMGHAMAMVGYKTEKNGKTFYLLQNSWGRDFGEDGFAYLDEDTLTRNFKVAYTLDIQPINAKPAPTVTPTMCKVGLLPDAVTGKCTPKCPDGGARNDGACAATDDCEKGEVNVKGKCVRAAPTFTRSKNGFTMSCVPSGCIYAFAKGVGGCPRDKGCVLACASPTFKLVARGNQLACN